jgi:hypothetical protein
MNLRSLGDPDTATLSPDTYHRGYDKRGATIPPEQRKFIAWDGEGINLNGPNRPQSYVLFGSSLGHVSNPQGLSTFDLLDHIISTGIANPGAFHVGFAFNYDSNMILKGLYKKTLKAVHKNGGAYLRKKDGTSYRIGYTPGKTFRVTKYGEKYDREKNPHDKVTVTIEDVFSFFTSSFIKAYEGLIGPVPEIISIGKANRSTFTIEEFDDVEKYWTVEIQMLRELAEELRKRLYDAGFKITSWYGPGALASYSMKHHGIKEHMNVSEEPVRKAARYGYAGGRFELFKVGRFAGPVYSLDINSAYPYAITQLPSLSEGTWEYVEYGPGQIPKRLASFGIYHLRYKIRGGFVKSAGPLFHRDIKHNISYPWVNEGWYWTPEVTEAIKLPGVEVIEGWEYVGWQSYPFEYIRDMFDLRRQWKDSGNPSQLALKLTMNSHYGKMAQRVGWDRETNRIPPWHQLEWAGWTTSHTRASLFSIMRQIPWEHLIAVETDGIYTTLNPATIGVNNSRELGGWEVTEYDEVLYVQSGLAWLRQGKTWTDKRRGLDADSFTLESAQRYLASLSSEHWEPFHGKTTRFIGLGAALASKSNPGQRHCVWQTSDRLISPGFHGKRIHLRSECKACSVGATALDTAHDLVIRSRAGLEQNLMSTPHYIPWESTEEDHAEWRVKQEEVKELING